MVISALMTFAVLLLALGLLVYIFPAGFWKKIFPGGRLAEKGSTGSLFLFSGLMLCGLLLVFINLMDIYTGWRSNSWPSVPATVISAVPKKVSQPRSSGDAWVPDIRYRYVFEGKTYTGSAIRFGSVEGTDPAWIDEQVKVRYAPGRELAVFVDPGKPERAVVFPGYDAFLFAYVLLGAVLAAVGGFYVRELYFDWNATKHGAPLTEVL